MIVDSSAVIAVLRGEPEAAEFIDLMLAHPCRMSAASWLEAAMVADSGGADLYDELIETARITVEDVTVAQAQAARRAFQRYGRGSGSPARLNYGDCLAYALSALSGEPLLFKGEDFIHTDVLKAR